MPAAQMSVPATKYLEFVDYLTGLHLDFMEAGMEATASDYALASGAILTLLTDLGALESDMVTLKV